MKNSALKPCSVPGCFRLRWLVAALLYAHGMNVVAGETNDADVFSLWESGIDALKVEQAVMQDKQITTAEILGAADVVLELKHQLKEEQGKATVNEPQLMRLNRQIDSFDKLFHRLLNANY